MNKNTIDLDTYIDSYIEGLAAQFCVPELQEIQAFEETQVINALSKLHISLLNFIRNVIVTAHRPLSLICEKRFCEDMKCDKSNELLQFLHTSLSKIHDDLISWVDIVISKEQTKKEENFTDLEELFGEEVMKQNQQFERNFENFNKTAIKINQQLMFNLTDKILVDTGNNAMFRGIDVTELDNYIFSFPGISNTTAFYDPKNFPQLKVLEDEFTTIQNEYFAFSNTEAYTSPGISFPLESVQHNWKTLWLLVGGQINEKNCSFFPKTTEILKRIPRVTREVLFSVLLPGAYIPTHKGNLNTTLRIQLGICGLQDCGLKVGDEIVQQQEGKIIIFDDFLPHSAWNNSKFPRVVLILDIIHPDITEEQYEEYGEIAEQLTNQSATGRILTDEISQRSQS